MKVYRCLLLTTHFAIRFLEKSPQRIPHCLQFSCDTKEKEEALLYRFLFFKLTPSPAKSLISINMIYANLLVSFQVFLVHFLRNVLATFTVFTKFVWNLTFVFVFTCATCLPALDGPLGLQSDWVSVVVKVLLPPIRS